MVCIHPMVAIMQAHLAKNVHVASEPACHRAMASTQHGGIKIEAACMCPSKILRIAISTFMYSLASEGRLQKSPSIPSARLTRIWQCRADLAQRKRSEKREGARQNPAPYKCRRPSASQGWRKEHCREPTALSRAWPSRARKYAWKLPHLSGWKRRRG